jgi:pilus assembly protein Flp/PilA
LFRVKLRVSVAARFYALAIFLNQCCVLSTVLEIIMRSRTFLWTLIPDTSGVTAIEYGLIAALIAVAAVVVMGTVGTNLSGVFSQVASSL